MARILIKDLGTRTGKKDGGILHRMQFSYACDQMEIGADAPMVNTFLQTMSHNKKTGKIYTSKDYYLSDASYDRLMWHVSTEGCEVSRWTGIVEAEVKKVGSDRGYRQTLDLSGPLRKPEIPFDEARHRAFVKASQRIAEAESILPKIASVDTEFQFER